MKDFTRLINYVFKISEQLCEMLSAMESILKNQEQLQMQVQAITVTQKPERWLTGDQAARLLNRHPRTIANWKEKGKLSYRIIGGHCFYAESYILGLKEVL